MTKEEYKKLKDITEITHTITGDDLENREDRVLLSGYTCDRCPWEVYLQGNIINVECREFNNELIVSFTEFDVKDNRQYIPDKRVYPEKSDYEFCKLLQEHGVDITFTTFTEKED